VGEAPQRGASATRGNPIAAGLIVLGGARLISSLIPASRPERDIADKAKAHGKPVTLCGEMASKPLCALALIALGYRSLSLTPSAIGPVKALLLDLDSRKAADFLQPLLEGSTGGAPIRERLTQFAESEGLQF